jgi:hypothetical protein
MKRVRILVATAGLIGVFVSAGLVSCKAQGGGESPGQVDELPGYTDESQIDLPDVESPRMFDPPPTRMRLP